MTEAQAVAVILALVVYGVVASWVAILVIAENNRLHKALDQADNNDARDARGRYSGRRAF